MNPVAFPDSSSLHFAFIAYFFNYLESDRTTSTLQGERQVKDLTYLDKEIIPESIMHLSYNNEAERI